MAIGLAAMISAQTREQRPGRVPEPMRAPAAETVTLSGSLIVAHGSPALKSGDDIYLLGGISRLTGFIDGLREGAQVTIEGRAFTGRQEDSLKFLRPLKLTLNGKTYDLSPPEWGNIPMAPGMRSHNAPMPHGSFRQFGAPQSGPQGPKRPPMSVPQERRRRN